MPLTATGTSTHIHLHPPTHIIKNIKLTLTAQHKITNHPPTRDTNTGYYHTCASKTAHVRNKTHNTFPPKKTLRRPASTQETPRFQVEPTLTANIYTQRTVKMLGVGRGIRHAAHWYTVSPAHSASREPTNSVPACPAEI